MKKIISVFGSFTPLLLYPILFIPYSFINSKVIVNILGCGCEEGFNANHFTRIFWGVVAVAAIVLSALITRKSENKFRGIVDTVLVAVISVILSYYFSALMMWK